VQSVEIWIDRLLIFLHVYKVVRKISDCDWNLKAVEYRFSRTSSFIFVSTFFQLLCVHISVVGRAWWRQAKDIR
jgi:hypothetical protein